MPWISKVAVMESFHRIYVLSSADSHFLSLSVLPADILLEAWWQIDSDPPRLTSLLYLTDHLSLTSYHFTEQQGETS